MISHLAPAVSVLCITGMGWLASGPVLAQAGGRPSLVPSQPAQDKGDPSMAPNRPLYVTGQVVMSNGEALPERVVIELVCSISGAQKEGYTDAAGKFSLQLGMNRGIIADPSGLGGNRGPNILANPLENAPTDTRFWKCDLRANLPGYQSSSISLAGRRYFDEPNVGNLVLTPFAVSEGALVSATSKLAPADARRAFQKGMDAMYDSKLDKAEQSFREAVASYGRYAEAWYQLGQAYRQDDKAKEAREAFLKAVEADPNYMYPYEGLYQLAFERDDMEDLLQQTETLLRLNPYEFPQAYYYSAVANLQLKHFEAGEERIRAAMEMDPNHEQPMEFYLLGFLLSGENKLSEAVRTFDTFLMLQPDGKQANEARDMRQKLQERLNTGTVLEPTDSWQPPASLPESLNQ